jgi:hypothetical protein
MNSVLLDHPTVKLRTIRISLPSLVPKTNFNDHVELARKAHDILLH